MKIYKCCVWQGVQIDLPVTDLSGISMVAVVNLGDRALK